MVEEGNRTDAQQGEVAALGRHVDPDAAVMKALLDGVERKRVRFVQRFISNSSVAAVFLASMA